MKITHFLFFLVVVVSAISCKQRTEAEKIVDDAIEAHGGNTYEQVKIDFDFRNEVFLSLVLVEPVSKAMGICKASANGSSPFKCWSAKISVGAIKAA